MGESTQRTSPFPGYRIVETDQQVTSVFPRNYTRWGARRRARRILGMRSLPSWRLEIEKHGLFDYRVVPYQNVLRKEDDGES